MDLKRNRSAVQTYAILFQSQIFFEKKSLCGFPWRVKSPEKWHHLHWKFRDMSKGADPLKASKSRKKFWNSQFLKSNETQEKIILRTFKGPIFSEKCLYYFHCPKKLCIFLPLDTAGQLESADSKHNTISKSLFQDGFISSFRHIFWAMRKMHHTFWKKWPLV